MPSGYIHNGKSINYNSNNKNINTCSATTNNSCENFVNNIQNDNNSTSNLDSPLFQLFGINL